MDQDRFRSLFDLTGRVAIVTGGTRGIGRAVAEAFVAAGAKVAVASRKADACAGTEAHLVAMGGEALGVPTHMGDLSALAALVRRTIECFGRLDIVVNNAATDLSQPLGAFTPEAWEKSYAVNLRGPVFLIQEALPQLRASPCAAIINVLSAAAFFSASPIAMYAAAKMALMSFTRSMAQEFAPLGIRVNALVPGTVDTDMFRRGTPAMREWMAAASFQRRVAHADEMVGATLLLASDAGSFITGQVIMVDGGLPH